MLRLGGSGRAPDRRLAQLIGMGEGGGLAGDAAKAEAGLGVEIGGLQPAVVEAEALRSGILQIELAIVAMAERLAGEAEGGGGV